METTCCFNNGPRSKNQQHVCVVIYRFCPGGHFGDDDLPFGVNPQPLPMNADTAKGPEWVAGLVPLAAVAAFWKQIDQIASLLPIFAPKFVTEDSCFLLPADLRFILLRTD